MVNSKQAEPGDLVNILLKPDGKKKEQGILLESHEPGIVLIKLSSGYNIGIKREDVKKLSVKEKADGPFEKSPGVKPSNKIKGKGNPRVDVIITGGTIASSLDPKTGGVKPLTNPEEFFRFYPELLNIVDVKIKNPFMKFSENMVPSDWIRIAKEVVKSLNDDECQGVIVTHGTDTLHYTASALSFMIKDLNKPVVLTYSQRSIDRGSSDAELNLYCAAKVALSNIGEVVLVGHGTENDDFCYVLQGNKTRKMHTSRRDAFKAINTSPIAKVTKEGDIEFLRDYWKRKKRKAFFDGKFEEKIGLIKYYPGQDPRIIDYYIKEKYKGLVIEMTGLGHVCMEGKDSWIPYLKKAVDAGIIVVGACQTLYGTLQPNVYESGRKISKTGVIFLKDLLPETALVKLGYILGHKDWREDIKEKLFENMAKEFNSRLGDDFV